MLIHIYAPLSAPVTLILNLCTAFRSLEIHKVECSFELQDGNMELCISRNMTTTMVDWQL